ncbi:MAG: hypothetical protein ACLQUY_16870 [Ktedonobacterales bacterium]
MKLWLTLARPTWSGSIIDLMRAALAWPERLVVLVASLWLSRTHFWSWKHKMTSVRDKRNGEAAMDIKAER